MTPARHDDRIRRWSKWSNFEPQDQWDLYLKVIDEACARGIEFALGGAFAVATYTGHWRNTKDLDLYVRPAGREQLIQVLTALGLKDYYDEKPYDRWWIYRGCKQGTIVDIIWAMANHRRQIDGLWMSGPTVDVRGRQLKVLPAEALIWDKLYIVQRERCDWPDILNLLYHAAADLDWYGLLQRLGDDQPLLAGLLNLFRWVAPGRAQTIPSSVWAALALPPMPRAPLPEIDRRRAALLDRRPWFGPKQEEPQPAD